MENASYWQCDGFGDQGYPPGYAGVWRHSGQDAVHECMSVSWSCFMPAVHACSSQHKPECIDGQLEAS
eukprot:1134335-Pelagomonas_calceolata.AAC.2